MKIRKLKIDRMRTMERKPRPNNTFRAWRRMTLFDYRKIVGSGSVGQVEGFTIVHSDLLVSELTASPTDSAYDGPLIEGELGAIDCGFVFKGSK